MCYMLVIQAFSNILTMSTDTLETKVFILDAGRNGEKWICNKYLSNHTLQDKFSQSAAEKWQHWLFKK